MVLIIIIGYGAEILFFCKDFYCVDVDQAWCAFGKNVELHCTFGHLTKCSDHARGVQLRDSVHRA